MGEPANFFVVGMSRCACDSTPLHSTLARNVLDSRFVRHGQKSSGVRDLDGDADSDAELLSAPEHDAEEESRMQAWLDGPPGDVTWTLLMGQGNMVVKHLPPGNVGSLYLEYCATQSFFGQRAVSLVT